MNRKERAMNQAGIWRNEELQQKIHDRVIIQRVTWPLGAGALAFGIYQAITILQMAGVIG